MPPGVGWCLQSAQTGWLLSGSSKLPVSTRVMVTFGVSVPESSLRAGAGTYLVLTEASIMPVLYI